MGMRKGEFGKGRKKERRDISSWEINKDGAGENVCDEGKGR